MLSLELLGRSLCLSEFPTRPDIIGLGMSDWDGYASVLAQKFSYQNTYYHQEPRLDIRDIDPKLEGTMDFVISSDVFEHVPPPVSMAFENARRLLKPNGILVFSTPYSKETETVEHFPELKVRVINVVDLMTLQPQSEHPHGLSDRDFDALFTKTKPVIFAYHGYPWLIHRLTYRRANHNNLHVRGYKEEGTTTTPFDMVVLNDLDRFHLVGDVIDRVASLGARAAYVKQSLRDKLIDHKHYIHTYGQDMPEIREWSWGMKTKKRSSPRPRTA